MARSKLPAVALVDLPAATGVEVLAGGDRRSQADDSRSPRAIPDVYLQYCEPGLRIVEGDVLDRAGEGLTRRRVVAVCRPFGWQSWQSLVG